MRFANRRPKRGNFIVFCVYLCYILRKIARIRFSSRLYFSDDILIYSGRRAVSFMFQSILKLSTLISIFLLVSLPAFAAGVLDPAFGTNGRTTTAMNYLPQAKAVLVQPDGKIVVVGDAAPTAGAKRDIAYARYNANGTLDTTFGFGGRAFVSISADNDFVTAAALQPDGKIIIVGAMEPTPGSTNTDFLIIRVNENGASLDSQFGNLGYKTINQGMFDYANSVDVQPDGRIVVAGNTSDTAGNIAVFRLLAGGAPDTSFANGGFMFYRYDIVGGGVSTVYTKNVKVMPDGRVLVGSAAVRPIFGQNAYTKSTVLLMLRSDGEIDQNFGGGGVSWYVYPVSDYSGIDFDLAILPNGNIMTVSNKNVLYSSYGSIEGVFPLSAPYSLNTDVAVRSDGKYITLNGGIHLFGDSKTSLHTPDNRFIGSTSEQGTDIVVQPDNKIIIIRSTETEFVVTRLLSISSQATRLADYNNDDITDIAVLRPTQSALYVLYNDDTSSVFHSGEASFEARRTIPERFASPLAFPFVYFRGGNIIGSPASFCGTNGVNRQCVGWGLIGDIPVGGDYDGDMFTEITVFRPSEGVWYTLNGVYNQPRTVQWGTSGDKPVPADYDYDGVTDYAVYRPSTGTWWILRSSDGGNFAVRFGISSDIPLTGDFDGDGRADFTVYRPSEGNWYQLLTTAGFRVVRFGLSSDVPVPGDYDGDGRHDVAVFRNGVWYLLQSTAGFKVVHWGQPSDIPAAVRYDR